MRLVAFYKRLLLIHIRGGGDPTYEIQEKPSEEVLGQTITSNYVSANITTLSNKETLTGMVKVRGNGSTIQQKNSYKLKFNKDVQLMTEGDYSYKEWVLLNNGDSLNTWIGCYVSRACGVDWVVPCQFVNVIMNGDWKGTYYLTPGVSVEASEGRIGQKGFLLENDAYWWADNQVYFRSNYKKDEPYFGWTLKYPKVNSSKSQECIDIKNYILSLEDSLKSDEWINYINEDDFASWILAKDILGVSDGGGSNMYYYMSEFDAQEPTKSELFIGPTWDFDSMYGTKDTWSCHGAPFYDELFSNERFKNLYTEKWINLADILCENIDKEFGAIQDALGRDLDESWKIEEERYNKKIESIDEQWSEAGKWYKRRVAWLNNATEQPAFVESSLILDNSWKYKTGMLNYELENSTQSGQVELLSGWAYVMGHETDANYGEIVYLTKDGAFYTNGVPRNDIMDKYSLDTK